MPKAWIAKCSCGWSSVYSNEVAANRMATNHQNYRNLNDSHTGFTHEIVIESGDTFFGIGA